LRVNSRAWNAMQAEVESLNLTDWNNKALAVYWPDVDVPGKPDYPHLKANLFNARPDNEFKVTEAPEPITRIVQDAIVTYPVQIRILHIS